MVAKLVNAVDLDSTGPRPPKPSTALAGSIPAHRNAEYSILVGSMARKPAKKHPGRRGLRVSLYPLTADEAVRGIFQIKPADVRKIRAKRPWKGKKKP